MKIFIPAWFVLWMLLILGGCRTVNPDFDTHDATASENQPPKIHFSQLETETELSPDLLEPDSRPYRLGVGDVVEIEIAGIGGTRAQTYVMPDGMLYYDLAGGVVAEDLTMSELAEQLEKELSRDYASPHVNVTLREVESRRFWILGRVFRPGLYPLDQPTTLLEAISRAGGLFTSRFSGSTEELADLGRSFIIRDGKILPVDFELLLRKGDTSQNVYVHPDDYIYLPSSLSSVVYVLGEVRQPKVVGFKDRLTLVSALANAKGPAPQAHLRQVVVIRGSVQEPKVAVVDFQKILSGQLRDIELQPQDLVWVPSRPFSRLEDYYWTIWDSAARTLAVREGANFAGGDGADVVIPVGN